jgi:hypothetical protein
LARHLFSLLVIAAIVIGVLWQRSQLAALALNRIDPVPETRELVAQERDAEAAGYLTFFMDYPEPPRLASHHRTIALLGLLGLTPLFRVQGGFLLRFFVIFVCFRHGLDPRPASEDCRRIRTADARYRLTLEPLSGARRDFNPSIDPGRGATCPARHSGSHIVRALSLDQGAGGRILVYQESGLSASGTRISLRRSIGSESGPL